MRWCRFACGVVDETLKGAAVVAYAPYYAAYETNRYVGALLPFPVSAGLVGVQAISLGADAGIDFLKRKAGTSPKEGTFDEDPPRRSSPINPFHGANTCGTPRSKQACTHLPGLWEQNGKKHVDTASPWNCRVCRKP
jgi:hypothetical protein